MAKLLIIKFEEILELSGVENVTKYASTGERERKILDLCSALQKWYLVPWVFLEMLDIHLKSNRKLISGVKMSGWLS